MEKRPHRRRHMSFLMCPLLLPFLALLPPAPLSHGVAAVNTEVGPRNILRGVGQKEGDRTHQVDGLAHLALRDEGGPLALELRVVVEDLLGAVVFCSLACASLHSSRFIEDK